MIVILDKKLYKSNFVIAVLAAVLAAVSFYLPIECSFENHIMENSEVVILAAGFLLMIHRCKYALRKAAQKLWTGCALLYLVMVMRELSWGRVFFPVGMRENGEQAFIPMSQISFAPLIYAAVAVMVLTALACMAKSLRECAHQEMSWKMPVWHLAAFAALMIVSQCVFEKGLIVGVQYGQLLEEAAEITAYASLVCFTANLSVTKQKKELLCRSDVCRSSSF